MNDGKLFLSENRINKYFIKQSFKKNTFNDIKFFKAQRNLNQTSSEIPTWADTEMFNESESFDDDLSRRLSVRFKLSFLIPPWK